MKINKIRIEETAEPIGDQAEKKEKRFRREIWQAAIILILALIFYLFKIANYYPVKQDLKHRPDFFGVTFSTKFCEELGLDWKETYQAILDELKVKYIRIPVYWDEIEKEEGNFDFTNYDYLLDAGEKGGVKFIMSIGRRVPRWPECHSPAWLNLKNDVQSQVAVLKMIRKVVEHYQDRVSIEYWQVENEPFLDTFGVCPPLDEGFLQQELDLIHSVDGRKIIITASGELSLWKKEAKTGDILGTTLYRVVYSSWFGHVKYPLATIYYHLKARLVGLSPDRLMVLELQAEPWVPKGKMIYLTTDEINRSMSVRQFKANLQYAINLNFSRNYIWGAEWWYWQKKYGNPEYWWIAASLFE